MDKELEKKRKAINQALATLKIDGITVNDSYLLTYKNIVYKMLFESDQPSLKLKLGGSNGINK